MTSSIVRKLYKRPLTSLLFNSSLSFLSLLLLTPPTLPRLAIKTMDNFYHSSQNFLNQNLARYPALAVGLPLVGGFISSSPSARTAKGYYESLDKSSWAPSPTVFGPVWTGLYLSIGYASHLVALHTDPTALTLPSIRSAAQTGLGLYGLSLALNFAWTPIFFWKKQIGAALVTAGGVFVSSYCVFD